MSDTVIYPLGDDTGREMLSALRGIELESIRQSALIATIANTSTNEALAHDWEELRTAVSEGFGQSLTPVGTGLLADLTDSHTGTSVTYQSRWNVAHFDTGALSDGETLPVMYLHMHNCLPFATQFSPSQAFLYSIDGLPAGTYNVTLSSKYVREAGTYQFTLTQDLPAGGQLAGFIDNGTSADVTVWASPSATSATETCQVSSGSGGTSLGTFSNAGVAVPASGTPASSSSVTVGGVDYAFYGLNSIQRVAYGNNRWLHSPLRQWLNSSLSSGWFVPQTVFDRPPTYVGYPGFLAMLPEQFVAAMQPIAQRTALNYVSDSGTSGSPEFDTTYDKVFLPSWKQHWLAVSNEYGSTDAAGEGEPWEYWERVAGTSSPLAGSTYNQTQTYHPEYVQRGIESGNPARYVWMRSANRGSATTVAIVGSAGHCGYGNACNGIYAAPACAIG